MDDLFELLRAEDVPGFQAARQGRGRLKFFGMELDGLTLVGVDLTGCTLDKSDLTGTNLTDARLIGASLLDIDGGELVLDGAIVAGAKLRGAWLEDADLTGADFSRADLTGCVVHRSRGEGLRLIEASLKDLEAHEVDWSLADFTEASLHGADFTGAKLKQVCLARTGAKHANFSGADLTGADAPEVKLAAANLTGAKLVGARLVGASLAGADLTGADLSRADLTRADLTGACLNGANLQGTVLIDAVLDGVKLEGTDLHGANLSGPDLDALGLAPEQAMGVAQVSVAWEPEAPLTYEQPEVGFTGDLRVVVWQNAEEAGQSLRWARQVADAPVQGGVLPVRADHVVFHAVLGLGAQVLILVLVERTDGVAALSWRVGTQGGLLNANASALGYVPAVRPLLQRHGQGVRLVGMMRKGPTLVIHEQLEAGEPFKRVQTTQVATARGFVGRQTPVLLGKGGVVQEFFEMALQGAVEIPKDFPARICDIAAVTSDGARQLCAVWATPARLRDPGGLRLRRLGQRPGELERISVEPGVLDLEILASGSDLIIAWVEEDGPDAYALCCTTWPSGHKVVDLDSGAEAWNRVRVIDDGAGHYAIAARSVLGRVDIWTPDGRLISTFGQSVLFEYV